MTIHHEQRPSYTKQRPQKQVSEYNIRTLFVSIPRRSCQARLQLVLIILLCCTTPIACNRDHVDRNTDPERTQTPVLAEEQQPWIIAPALDYGTTRDISKHVPIPYPDVSSTAHVMLWGPNEHEYALEWEWRLPADQATVSARMTRLLRNAGWHRQRRTPDEHTGVLEQWDGPKTEQLWLDYIPAEDTTLVRATLHPLR